MTGGCLIVTAPDYLSQKNAKPCFHAISNVNYLIPVLTVNCQKHEAIKPYFDATITLRALYFS